MSDVKKSVALRVLLFVLGMAILLITVSALNIVHDHLLNGWIKTPSHVIESVVFIYVSSRAIWRWLSRRVWIGTQAP